MKLRFDLDNIKYLKLKFKRNRRLECVKLSLKEKVENKFIATTTEIDVTGIEFPQETDIDFICYDGIYRTKANLISIYNEDGLSHFIIQNPKSLNYQENRNFHRVLANHDCIYTIYNHNTATSYDACTYDISVGGVSIILPEIAVSREEASILLMLDDFNIKTHVRFIRCEIYNDDYKLSFEFTDLSDRDYKVLSELCRKEQQTSQEVLY